jgi:hypothetical protein
MSFNKIDGALYGPSTLEVALGAALGLALGAVVAATYLVLKPVIVVTQMPKEMSLTSVYYQPGSANKAKSTDWPAKQNQFIAGTTVQVTEDELNAWSLAGGTPPRNAMARSIIAPSIKLAEKSKFAEVPDKTKPSAKAKPVEAGEASGGPQPATATKMELPVTDTFLTTKVPNFRMVGDALQIGWRCTLNVFGLTREVALVATGHFETSGAQVSFVPDKVFLGSCPLHWLPMASSQLLAYVFKNQKTPDNIRLAWAKCTAVQVVDGGLRLILP